jgi:hypothetical protein
MYQVSKNSPKCPAVLREGEFYSLGINPSFEGVDPNRLSVSVL